MARIAGFAPLLGRRPRVLILGTMPGAASLQAGEYYAHPRNQFWPIMGELAGATPQRSYAQRCRRITAAGFAVWDVLQHCERPGSLDGSIVRASEVPNNIGALLLKHPTIRLLAFNGGNAEKLFRRHVAPALPGPLPQTLRLPATSPAHARMSPARKLQAWSVLREGRT